MRTPESCDDGRVGPGTYTGKRLLDLGLSWCALLVSAPALVVIAVVVRLFNGSPVLFRQERPGLHGRPFRIWKFRTMREAVDSSGRQLPDGERLTRIGRFLRVSSLDELPELWNVIRGEMSIVGPRPLLFRYLPYFTPRERTRLLVLPGITGLAQVSGRNEVGWDRRLELDAIYVETMSLGLDLRILLRTVASVFLGHGASPDPDAVETWLDEERSARPGGRSEGSPGSSRQESG